MTEKQSPIHSSLAHIILYYSTPSWPCQDHHLQHPNRVFSKRFTVSLDQISSWLWLMDVLPKGNSSASIVWETSYLKMRKKREILRTAPMGRRMFTDGKRNDCYHKLLYQGRDWLGCRFQRTNTRGGREAHQYKPTLNEDVWSLKTNRSFNQFVLCWKRLHAHRKFQMPTSSYLQVSSIRAICHLTIKYTKYKPCIILFVNW